MYSNDNELFIILCRFLKSNIPCLKHYFGRARISKDGKIASFTGRLECAKRFSNGKGSLIICDAKETLAFVDTLHKPGEYTHTFYPLVDVPEKQEIPEVVDSLIGF